MGASSKGLLSPQREGTDQKRGICDAGALVLNAAAAPGGTEEAVKSSSGWLLPPVCCLPVHHSF